jgi:hypothetical protein
MDNEKTKEILRINQVKNDLIQRTKNSKIIKRNEYLMICT